MLLIKSNKRGWIRIVEAFVAVLLVAGMILFLFNRGYIGKSDISEKVDNEQKVILREIALDQGLRQAILSESVPIGTQSNDNNNLFPNTVLNKINERKPDFLECITKICALDEICTLSSIPQEIQDKDIYARSIAITATVNIYNPRQLKMFCWVK